MSWCIFPPNFIQIRWKIMGEMQKIPPLPLPLPLPLPSTISWNKWDMFGYRDRVAQLILVWKHFTNPWPRIWHLRKWISDKQEPPITVLGLCLLGLTSHQCCRRSRFSRIFAYFFYRGREADNHVFGGKMTAKEISPKITSVSLLTHTGSLS